MKYLHIPTFIISLSLGLLYVYLNQPPLQPIHVYPQPNQLVSIQYQDKAQRCYMYDAKEKPCNANAVDFPIQN